jgi:hypothetical protein
MKYVNLRGEIKKQLAHGKEIKGHLCDILSNNLGQWANIKHEQQIKVRKMVHYFPLIS